MFNKSYVCKGHTKHGQRCKKRTKTTVRLCYIHTDSPYRVLLPMDHRQNVSDMNEQTILSSILSYLPWFKSYFT